MIDATNLPERPAINTRLENFLDMLLRMLPRSAQRVTLTPEVSLTADANSSNGWWAEGPSPAFALTGEAALFEPGQLYIEGVLQRYSLSKARLYLDTGNGCTKESSLVIPVTRRGYIREVVRLPPGVVGLRWAPIDSIGYFVHQGLVITRIGRIEAGLRSLYRVLFDLARFIQTRERRNDAINTLLKPLLRFRLQEAYRNTVNFRVFDSTPRTPTELWTTYQAAFQLLLPVIEKKCSALQNPPLISCIISLTGTTLPDRIDDTIRSLQRQCYPPWELLIVGDSAIPHNGLPGMGDKRIRYIQGDPGTILPQTSGRYLLFLEQGVQLEPQALFHMQQTFQEQGAELVYADGVLTSADGETVEELICHPAFSPELLRGRQYIRHLTGYDRQLLDILGEEPPAASPHLQQYDLLLRAAEAGAQVAHIPQILYRAARRDSADDYDKQAADRIVQRHLERSSRAGQTEIRNGAPETRRISYRCDPAWRVAILIPTRDAVELVRQCVASLDSTIRGLAYDVIIIDHASQEPATLQYFQEISDKHTILRYNGDFNFSHINNWAVEQIAGPYSHYLFCNNDVEATAAGWLETMLGFTGEADVGVVGAELLYPDRSHIQHAGVGIGLHGLAEHYGKFAPVRMKTQGGLSVAARIALTCPHEVSAVTAACMLVRREAFEAVGGFDQQMAVGFGDVDLCLRIGQAGYRCIYSPDSSLIHHESLTRGKDGGDPHPLDTVYFKKRWQQMIDEGDPYFHPAYSRYSFSWQYTDPLPCVAFPAARIWKRKSC